MSLFLAYTIVLMTGVFVILGLMLFAEYRKLEALESYFTENEKVRRNKRFWGRNQRIDRLHRMLLIIGFLSMPKFHVKAGLVTEAELASVPLALKRWALWPYRLAGVWCFAGLIWSLWHNA